jgi:hypothetical protein
VNRRHDLFHRLLRSVAVQTRREALVTTDVTAEHRVPVLFDQRRVDEVVSKGPTALGIVLAERARRRQLVFGHRPESLE